MKFKNYVRGNTKSVATLQKNPTVIKEVEKFTSNAAVINEIKGNPTTIKRLESLGKQPAIVESLQKAPVETSVKRVQTYLSRSESNLVSEKTKWVVFFLSFFVIFGGVIGLITLLEKLVGPGVD
ncbi:hypothetical protein PHMEG_00018611 [Phytophthora megakarya]|uniref:Uncharacterized protein n=1 Tax=Phytophthora megakarya TaxID=4795 RepID=A0A225VTY7_9STRA|nr:hypothetical protein PHMEG_00018611 [Phytophthora megakarya]